MKNSETQKKLMERVKHSLQIKQEWYSRVDARLQELQDEFDRTGKMAIFEN